MSANVASTCMKTTRSSPASSIAATSVGASGSGEAAPAATDHGSSHVRSAATTIVDRHIGRSSPALLIEEVAARYEDADAVGEREVLGHRLGRLWLAVDEPDLAHRAGAVARADAVVGDHDANVREVEGAVGRDAEPEGGAGADRLRPGPFACRRLQHRAHERAVG